MASPTHALVLALALALGALPAPGRARTDGSPRKATVRARAAQPRAKAGTFHLLIFGH